MGRGEGTVLGFGLGAEVRGGRVDQVCGGHVWGGEVDFRLASLKRQLHFARRSCCILVDGIRLKVGVIVFAFVVQRFDIDVSDCGACDGGGRLRPGLVFPGEETT